MAPAASSSALTFSASSFGRSSFTFDGQPPLKRLVTFQQLGVSNDTTPVKFTHRGDLQQIEMADVVHYNLPPDANGKVGQFSHYEA